MDNRLIEKQLIELQKKFKEAQTILENIGCAIYIVDYVEKEILYTNAAFWKIMGEDLSLGELNSFFFEENHRECEFSSHEVWFQANNKWLEMSQSQIKWADEKTVVLGIITDITDKMICRREMEDQISKDHLTGLYNRMRCEQDLNHYIKDAEKNGSEGAFLLIDLDDFQNINYGLGHQYGDALLKTIAHNLVRVAGIEDNCYRMNGDEFAVIVHGENYKELSRICKEMREIFNRPWFLKNEDYYCTMSMGVVCFPTDGNNVDDLNRKVDLALSTAKKKGKNGVEFYNEKIEDTSYCRLDMEQCMRRATLNSCNEFEVYYQPIVQMEGEKSRCCGAEALVRWNSAELGHIMPGDFIPLAEYLGLINPIGEHVLSEAVKHCKFWNDSGYPDYKVDVNISVVQLLQPDFVTKVKAILDRNHINPKNVVLEVTESLAINDMERMKKVLMNLQALGVGIALDDFGVGYSSLNHIRQLPVNIIKVDRCFVENLAEDEFAKVFVKMVSELAETMGIRVCVEGIEQKEQFEILSGMHIDMVQGYYFGKPMKAKEFEKNFF